MPGRLYDMLIGFVIGLDSYHFKSKDIPTELVSVH